MEHPSLIRLRVARRHRREALEGPQLLDALERDLDRIEAIAREIFRLRKRGDLSARLAELQDLMSLDAAPIVPDADGESYRRLTADIRHDRRLIADLRAGSADGASSGRREMRLTQALMVPDPPPRYGPCVSRWEGDVELWLGYVANEASPQTDKMYRVTPVA